ncbi:MAG: hypothetical protein AAFR81_30170 [Chloroflexota bacterium]
MVDDRLWDELIPDDLAEALERDPAIQQLWKQYDDEWRDNLPVGTRVILMDSRNHVSYVPVGEWGTVIEHNNRQGVFSQKGRGLGVRWESGLIGFCNPLLVWNEEDYMSTKRDLWVTVRSESDSTNISIVGKMPDHYDVAISLPMTIANGIPYEPRVFMLGAEMSEEEAKVIVTRLLESPIWRARLVGKYHHLPHDDYWNAFFIVDNRGEDLGVLNLRYVDSKIDIHVQDNYPAFLPLSRDEYDLQEVLSLYQEAGYLITEMVAVSPEKSRAYVGVVITAGIDGETVGNSVNQYLEQFRQ